MRTCGRSADPEAAWGHWRGIRDRMYREHPQSPIPADSRGGFTGCRFYPYDPSWRVVAEIHDDEPDQREISASTGGTFSFTRIGTARFEREGVEHELELELERRLRRWHLPRLHRSHERRDDLRRGPLPARHGQGRRPRLRPRARHGGPRLQLRVQPLMLVRRTVGVPSGSARQPPSGRGDGRRTAPAVLT